MCCTTIGHAVLCTELNVSVSHSNQDNVDLTAVQEAGSMVGDLGDKSSYNTHDVKAKTFNETRSELLNQGVVNWRRPF